MKNHFNKSIYFLAGAIFLVVGCSPKNVDYLKESKKDKDKRMEWWRDARFGMFIHWGLYAVPAGEWDGVNTYGEWIRHSAKIPLETYDKFVAEFNPTKFNADAWVKMAKNAGMKYIVITSKHHDGFGIFDSQQTDFDIMSTPFKRDVLKELADACQREGIKLCFYHSIMDWHHPDYLPRRNWETDRSTEGADYERYVQYMKAQLKELLTNYGEAPHVLWFDGEWENTWTHNRGVDLYNYVRSLKPGIIINNRVDSGRDGMAGMSDAGFAGDFGTPEQEIPATGLPGVDWESCMTMNDNWGYNKADKNFKSTRELIRNLTDIASKGGNYLLNIGPTAEGVFPPESIQRLEEIGAWMKQNGDAIYGTSASPFGSFSWGRCTMKRVGADTYLYLHVFEAPKDGRLVLNGIANEPMGPQYLAFPSVVTLPIHREEDALVVEIDTVLPDKNNSVIVLPLKGKPDFHLSPQIVAKYDLFINEQQIAIRDEEGDSEIHYTLDGSPPSLQSAIYTVPLSVKNTSLVSARSFRKGQPISGTLQRTFIKVRPQSASGQEGFSAGLAFAYYEGDWDSLPDFNKLQMVASGITNNFKLKPTNDGEHYGYQFSGFVKIPKSGVYTFSTSSDDGSSLLINNRPVVDNDGTHGMREKSEVVVLEAGYHEIIVRFFEKTGGEGLQVFWESEDFGKQAIPDSALFYLPGK
ncbi:MAG: alpha-L-fucosidase [Saprospiraceae bacterium]